MYSLTKKVLALGLLLPIEVFAAVRDFHWNLTYEPLPGTQKKVILINGKWPPESIEVDVNDRIVLTVVNDPLKGVADGVTLHAHGLHQQDNNYQDGPEGVTQCDIKQGDKQVQYPYGLRSPLIVRSAEDPNYYGYDAKSDYVMDITDNWFASFADVEADFLTGRCCFDFQEHEICGMEIPPDNALVHDDLSGSHTYQAQKSKKMRVRIINMAAASSFYVFANNPDVEMSVIEADGVALTNTNDARVKSIQIHPGQRYSVLINSDKSFNLYSVLDPDQYSGNTCQHLNEMPSGVDRNVGAGFRSGRPPRGDGRAKRQFGSPNMPQQGGPANGNRFPPMGQGQGNRPPQMGQGQGNRPPPMSPGQGSSPPPMSPGQGNRPPPMNQGPGNRPPPMSPGQGNSPPPMSPGQGSSPPPMSPGQGNRPPPMSPGQGNRPPPMGPGNSDHTERDGGSNGNGNGNSNGPQDQGEPKKTEASGWNYALMATAHFDLGDGRVPQPYFRPTPLCTDTSRPCYVRYTDDRRQSLLNLPPHAADERLQLSEQWATSGKLQPRDAQPRIVFDDNSILIDVRLTARPGLVRFANMNDKDWTLPQVPLLLRETQLRDNCPTLDVPSGEVDALYGSNNTWYAKKGTKVFFIVGSQTGPHPFHLHGYEYQVLFVGQENEGLAPVDRFNNTDVGMPTEDDLRSGRIPLKENPLRRDTIHIHAKTYSIIAITADNPGAWFLHCHNDFHAITGMAGTLIVDSPDDGAWNNHKVGQAVWDQCGFKMPNGGGFQDWRASCCSDPNTCRPALAPLSSR